MLAKNESKPAMHTPAPKDFGQNNHDGLELQLAHERFLEEPRQHMTGPIPMYVHHYR